jgi:hypothetical protein
VEFREPDGDGGDAIATTIFSYRTRDKLTKRQVHEEIVRKARLLLGRFRSSLWHRAYVTLVPENADTGPQKRRAAEITLLLRTLSPGVTANEEFSFDLYSHGSSNV